MQFRRANIVHARIVEIPYVPDVENGIAGYVIYEHIMQVLREDNAKMEILSIDSLDILYIYSGNAVSSNVIW